MLPKFSTVSPCAHAQENPELFQVTLQVTFSGTVTDPGKSMHAANPLRGGQDHAHSVPAVSLVTKGVYPEGLLDEARPT